MVERFTRQMGPHNRHADPAGVDRKWRQIVNCSPGSFKDADCLAEARVKTTAKRHQLGVVPARRDQRDSEWKMVGANPGRYRQSAKVE